MPESDQITLLLQRLRGGDRGAEAELMPAVYAHLHRLAERQFKSERAGHTLQPTALVSELYLRIVRDTTVDWKSRAHFYAVAAETVRRILVDHARAANAERRPHSACRVDLDEVIVHSRSRTHEILLIDEALEQLRAWDPRQARIVDLRFFGGLSIEETAHVLGVADRTVKRDWALARAWLSSVLNGGDAILPQAS